VWQRQPRADFDCREEQEKTEIDDRSVRQSPFARQAWR